MQGVTQTPLLISITSTRLTLPTKVSVSFKMILPRLTLFKQSAMLISVTSTTPTLIVLKSVSVG
jgi:hypothetical protein